MSGKDKWVRRFSVDETARHKNGFTIYKITSVLFPLSSPAAGTSVSVWKRFSDAQRLRRGMRALHKGLGLPGRCPALPQSSFFRRFEPQVLQERCKAIQELLEFVAEHRLLFASTEFVHFLQSGYSSPPRPAPPRGPIAEIRSALLLPPLDAGESPRDTLDGATDETTDNANTQTIDVSNIQIFGAADVEMPTSPTNTKGTDSSESLSSLDSIKSDLFEEVSRMTIDKPRPCVRKKSVLPDLINFGFDVPSTSRFDDGNTSSRARSSVDTDSVNSSCWDDSESKRSLSVSSNTPVPASTSVVPASTSVVPSSSSDAYIFSAGRLLQRGGAAERRADYRAALQLYKEGIELMLLGVHTDTDPQRRALIKDKSNKYLTHAEAIYNQHLAGNEDNLAPPAAPSPRAPPAPPARLLQRDYAELALYRVLAIIQGRLMLVLYEPDNTKRVIKVIQKIPNNLTEFDELFPRQAMDTKQPILPTNIPYMVNLDSYIETPNLIFLVLEYAPGEKLFDYIKNYVKSIPNTPSRELNLENVFSEPLTLKNDKAKPKDGTNSIDNRIESKNNNLEEEEEEEGVVKKTDSLHTSEISTNELVMNSQRLLMNLNKVLNDDPNSLFERDGDVDKGDAKDKDGVQVKVEEKEGKVNGREAKGTNKTVESSSRIKSLQSMQSPRLPPAAIRSWAAQLLLAIDSLHNCGVVCRDLNPSNILLGSHGRVLLTYFIGYDPPPSPAASPAGGYMAPELQRWPLPAGGADVICDYWSYGAVLYYLICGFPLQCYHRGPFTSHSILQLPAGLPVEAASILTQLLSYDPHERLGANGVHEIKSHPYFKNIDWRQVYDDWLLPD